MSKKQPPEGLALRVNVEVHAELEAVYANLVIIRHSSSEIVIDFIRRMPDVARARVYARVVMTPMNAKLFPSFLGQRSGLARLGNPPIREPDDPAPDSAGTR